MSRASLVSLQSVVPNRHSTEIRNIPAPQRRCSQRQFNNSPLDPGLHSLPSVATGQRLGVTLALEALHDGRRLFYNAAWSDSLTRRKTIYAGAQSALGRRSVGIIGLLYMSDKSYIRTRYSSRRTAIVSVAAWCRSFNLWRPNSTNLNANTAASAAAAGGGDDVDVDVDETANRLRLNKDARRFSYPGRRTRFYAAAIPPIAADVIVALSFRLPVLRASVALVVHFAKVVGWNDMTFGRDMATSDTVSQWCPDLSTDIRHLGFETPGKICTVLQRI